MPTVRKVDGTGASPGTLSPASTLQLSCRHPRHPLQLCRHLRHLSHLRWAPQKRVYRSWWVHSRSTTDLRPSGPKDRWTNKWWARLNLVQAKTWDWPLSGSQFQFSGSKAWDLPGGGRDPSSSPGLHPQTAWGPLPEAWQTGEKSSYHVKIWFMFCWSNKYVKVPVLHIAECCWE